MGVDLSAGGASLAIGALGIVLLLVIGLAWFTVAATIALKGGPVDQPNRVAQLYGYTVCLVALVVALLSTTSLINAAIDRANPLQSEYSFGASLSSFEAFKATQERERVMRSPSDVSRPDTTSEVTLRTRYDALVADRAAATRYRTSKASVTSGILLGLAVLLFLFHWRWMRRLKGSVQAAG